MPPTEPPYRLPNGAHVAECPEAGSRWVGIGLWLRAGSRFERPDEAGWAHLLEHLWFRGGARHDAAAVDRVCDRLGGHVNAETGRELIGLWGLAPADRGPELLELVTDLFLEPRFDDDDLALERRLIGGETRMPGGDPLATVADGLLDGLWGGHALARPIGGYDTTLARADAAALHAWRRKRLAGPRTAGVVVGAGARGLAERLAHSLASLPTKVGTTVPEPDAPRPHPPPPPRPAPPGPAGLLWAFPLPGWCHPDHTAARLALTAIAGGPSALLPAALRRETGAVYDLGCHLETAFDASAGFVQATAPSAAAVAAAIEERLNAVARHGLPEEMLATAHAQHAAREALAETAPVDAMRRYAWGLISGYDEAPARHVSPDVLAAFSPDWRWRAVIR